MDPQVPRGRRRRREGAERKPEGRKRLKAERQWEAEWGAERKQLEAKLKQVEAERKQLEAELKQLEAERKQLEAERKQLGVKRKQWEVERKQWEGKRKEWEAERNRNLPLQKRDWLGQVLPSLHVEYESGSLPARRTYDNFIPQSVKSWKSFRHEAVLYDDERIPDFFPINELRFMISRKDRPVDTQRRAGLVMDTVLSYLCLDKDWIVEGGWKTSIAPGEGRESGRDSTEATSDDSVGQRFTDTPKRVVLDIVVRRGEIPILAVEMMPPSSFAGNRDEDTNLVRSYGDRNGEKHRHHSKCVHELMCYMVKSKVIYGLICSAELTYFARRVQGNDLCYSSLEISEAIRFDSKGPTLLEALFFILNKSDIEAGSGVNYRFKTAVDPDSNEDAAKDDSLKRKAKKGRAKKISQTGTRKSPRIQSGKAVDYCELKDTAVSNLHLERSPLHSCRGWNGSIGVGFINGQRVAVKIARKNTEKAEALLREMTAYKMLERYWGRYVPELVNYGTTSNGTLVFIAIQFIDGSKLWRRAPSEAECRAAEEALDGIHSSGMLHGDVHGENIIFVEGGVRFIDFGSSRFITNEADCSKELNQLRRLLQRRVL